MIIAKLTLGTQPDLVVAQAQADAGNMPANLAQVVETSRQTLAVTHTAKQTAIQADHDARQKRSGVKKNGNGN